MKPSKRRRQDVRAVNTALLNTTCNVSFVVLHVGIHVVLEQSECSLFKLIVAPAENPISFNIKTSLNPTFSLDLNTKSTAEATFDS